MALAFGIFDHLDRGTVPLAEFYEEPPEVDRGL